MNTVCAYSIYMDLRDLAHKRLSTTTWLTAHGDEFAWRWTAEEHYAFLRDRANELLQLGHVTIAARNLMATEAFDKYHFYLRHRAEAEATFSLGFEYQVWEEDRLIAATAAEGQLFEVATSQLMGCISRHHGPEADWHITRWVDYVEIHLGYLRGLVVERPAGPPWRLALKQRSQPPKRWAADTPRY